MKPFYETMKDIVTIFNNEQIRETFRFDRVYLALLKFGNLWDLPKVYRNL